MSLTLNFKTVKGRKFSLETQAGEEYAELKRRVADVIDADPAGVRLIHKGKMLNAGAVDARFKTGDTVIVMSKPKPKPKPTKPQSATAPTPAPAQAEAPAVAEPAPAQAPAQAQPAPAQAAPAQAAPAQAQAPAPAQVDEAAVEQLMMLGDFTRPQVVRALEMANGSPDMAANLLFSGSVPRMPAPRPAAQQQQAAPQQAQAQQQQQQQPAMGDDEGEPLNMENFQQVLQQNPQLLMALLARMAAANPEMAALIRQNPQAVMQMLQDPRVLQQLMGAAAANGGMGPPPQENPNAIRLTQEEAEAVQRLALLGFPEQLALQAYLLCDKNENAAATYLFENQESLMADWNSNPENQQ